MHRALERAFTRPLGALPRLPPYLPPNVSIFLFFFNQSDHLFMLNSEELNQESEMGILFVLYTK